MVSVRAPVLELRLMLEPELLTASDLTPELAIVILLAALVIVIPLPCVSVALANPEEEPISS
jgi:hypothetical protein